MTQFSKTQIETLLGSCLPVHLRAIISKMALKTPDVIYGSGGIDPAGRDNEKMQGVTPALLLLAAHGASEIDPGLEMIQDFKGLSNETTGPYGDWSVEITHSDIDSEELACEGDATGVAELAALPHDDIRAILSELARKTPATLYIDEDFAAEQESKTITDGSKISPTSQAGMFLCSKLRDVLEPGQYWHSNFVAMKHGSGKARLWILKVTRHSD